MIEAVIFDVYKTLLFLGPRPENAEQSWEALCGQMLPGGTPMSLDKFWELSLEPIKDQHHRAKELGIRNPEVDWPSIVSSVIPSTALLGPEDRDEFLYRQISLYRSLRLMPDADRILEDLSERRIPLGIASNAQHYTFRELETALQEFNLSADLFPSDLTCWSFLNGFSKPNPHVFRILTSKFLARGIPPERLLMVGDRIDNDIVPAAAQGWQTWHLTVQTDSEQNVLGGSWTELGSFLQNALA
jgi:FMN phosphatase YigB (HAD superfamily)